MKTIQPISIWDNGKNLEATILNAYAVNVLLGTSATFYYSLITENEDGSKGIQVRDGNLTMTGEVYTQWEADSYAWDWIAAQLKLTITGDYILPVPTNVEEPIVEVPAFEEPVIEEPIIVETKTTK